ncbi:hypothetical protein [Helicobacter cetorum]|uniref:hypothetical protein n=1 Tax=Helicobacter cetorum TaxID=138563 RepID=UPI000CF0BC52|nr:hypothetical protein [Helicobacter cetorum]
MKKILCIALMGALSVLYSESSGAYGEVGFQWANQSYTNTTKTPSKSGYNKNAEINSSAFGNSSQSDTKKPSSAFVKSNVFGNDK